jgi:ribosomal protein S18 acetylase RimI-like enzyme
MNETVKLKNTISSKEEILSLLSQFPFKPLRYHKEIDERELTEYLLYKIENLATDPKNFTITIKKNESIKGLVVVEHLDFDTSILKKRSAKIVYLITSGESYREKSLIAHDLLKEVDERCRREGVCFLSYKIDLSDTPSLHQLEGCGFRLMGVEITLSLGKEGNIPSLYLRDYKIRECRERDIEELKRITTSSTFLDRFHTDPALPKSLSDALYEKWIENCWKDKNGAVLVAEDTLGTPKGYVALHLERVFSFEIGSIVLVAVSPNSTGKGIGQALTREGVRWLRERGARCVEVETQARNYRALWVFQKVGFRVALGRAVFHKWFKVET